MVRSKTPLAKRIPSRISSALSRRFGKCVSRVRQADGRCGAATARLFQRHRCRCRAARTKPRRSAEARGVARCRGRTGRAVCRYRSAAGQFCRSGGLVRIPGGRETQRRHSRALGDRSNQARGARALGLGRTTGTAGCDSSVSGTAVRRWPQSARPRAVAGGRAASARAYLR